MAINPISNLYEEYIKIVQSAIIKYNSLAEPQETLETRKYVDRFLDAYLERDSYKFYEYTIEDLSKVRMSRSEMEGVLKTGNIPEKFKRILLKNKRQEIIEEYDEPNDYYRMLNGLPDKADKESDFVYASDDIAEKYGFDKTIPIHLIEKKAGVDVINALEVDGYIDTLIEQYPTKDYLQFLGSRKIDIIQARTTKNFGLLRVSSEINDILYPEFLTVYEQCREYFVSTVYIPEYRTIIDYYDEFIAMCIMVMTINQLTARSLGLIPNRDFYDTVSMKMLFDSYNLPYFSRIDPTVQRAICKNLNMLIRDKGTSKVIYDICSLLGFDKITVYKYFLVKSHNLDVNGNPIFADKQIFDDEKNDWVTEPDYEKMFDIYFQKIDLKNYDYFEAMLDRSNKVSYEEITTNDPLWIEDDDTYREVYEDEYNYKETKYLGITIAYKLSELIYQNIILLRMLMSKSQEVKDVIITIPKILESGGVDLFQATVLLCALTSKKYGLRGDIVTVPSQVIHTLDALDRLYNPDTVSEVMEFNFKWFNEGSYKQQKAELFKYFTEAEKKEFDSYVSILTVTNVHGSEKVAAINKMYDNIKSLSKFLSKKIAASTDIDEYRALNIFHRALYYSKESSKAFTVKGIEGEQVATTFLEYLQFTNNNLYEFVRDLPQENCHRYIEHVISRLETKLNDLGYLYVMNDSNSSLQDILLAMIKFFKSYTTDLIGLNIVYIFDFKPDNMLKFIDKIGLMKKSMELGRNWNDGESINLTYSDDIFSHKLINDNDMLSYRDDYNMLARLTNRDIFTMKEMMMVSKLNIIPECLELKEELLAKKSMTFEDYNMYRDKIHRIFSVIRESDELKLLEKNKYIKMNLLHDLEFSMIDFLEKVKAKIKIPHKFSFTDFIEVTRIPYDTE